MEKLGVVYENIIADIIEEHDIRRDEGSSALQMALRNKVGFRRSASDGKFSNGCILMSLMRTLTN